MVRSLLSVRFQVVPEVDKKQAASLLAAPPDAHVNEIPRGDVMRRPSVRGEQGQHIAVFMRHLQIVIAV